MKRFLLPLLMMLSLNALANEKGNGGDVVDLRTYYNKALSERDFDELFAHNALLLKKGLIIPMFEYASASMISDEVARQNFNLIKVKSLNDDITFSIFEFGSCSDGRDACVEEEKPFSKITFNKESLLSKSTSLADLGGLVAHEYEHKYAQASVEHTNYGLGKFFKERIDSNTHIGQDFSLTPTANGAVKPIWHKVGQSQRKYVLVSFPKNVTRNANNFCRYQGFQEAFSYETKSTQGQKFYWFNIEESNVYGEPNVYQGHGALQSTVVAFSKITCIH